jgi:hypothetical protein
MRRDLNWKTKREDGTSYEVRVVFFGKKFQIQFKEKGAEDWDHKRRPSRDDLEQLVETMERYYARKRATPLELAEAKKLLLEFDHDAKPWPGDGPDEKR